MASTAAKLMTADEFLVWSQDQEVRYELVDGIATEMTTGASDVHDRIVVSLLGLLERIGCRLPMAAIYEETGLREGEPPRAEA